MTTTGREVLLQRDHQQRVGHKVHARRAVHPGAGLHDAEAVGHQHGVEARGHVPRAREPAQPGAAPCVIAAAGWSSGDITVVRVFRGLLLHTELML